MSRIAHAIDSLVSVFSPRSAIERAFHRELLEKVRQRSQYAAAKTTRLTGAWSPVDSPVNTVIGNSLQAVRARVRQLGRDFPTLARAIDVACDYTVGDVIKFQSRVKTPEGKLDKKRCQKIEALENAIIEYLRPGENVVLTSNTLAGNNFSPFVKLILTMFSIVAGVP